MRLLAGALLFILASTSAAESLTSLVKPLAFDELLATYSESRVQGVLGEHADSVPESDRAAAALLVDMGALAPRDLDAKDLVARVERYVQTVTSKHPALMGRIGDAALYGRMADGFDHQHLLAEDDLTLDLGKALNEGVLTGYDLRSKAVYDDLPAGLTFIYSQASLTHMRQLVTLLAAEGVKGWVSITPKVSAFLYREDWGPASDRVKTLPGGVRVVNGEEIAVMFQFDTRDDLKKFHDVIVQFAKKDEKDEPGLIANSWWQPFYYSDEPFTDFKKISLVVVSAGEFEATLTVLTERTAEVTDWFEKTGREYRIDEVWVNPPFYRFLNGDYR